MTTDMSTCGPKVLGTIRTITNKRMTKDVSLIRRIEALLKFIPEIKDAVMKKDKTLKKRLKIVMNLSKMSVNLLKCRETYFRNIELSDKVKIGSNIPSLVDDIQGRISYYMSILISNGYDMDFFMKHYTPEARGIVEVKKDEERGPTVRHVIVE